jgi:hypothetical protein
MMGSEDPVRGRGPHARLKQCGFGGGRFYWLPDTTVLPTAREVCLQAPRSPKKPTVRDPLAVMGAVEAPGSQGMPQGWYSRSLPISMRSRDSESQRSRGLDSASAGGDFDSYLRTKGVQGITAVVLLSCLLSFMIFC